VPHDQIPTYYNLSDIVTIPTYHSEGSSIACIEAMACGKPLVVTDVGGLKELVYQDIVDGGLKVKPDSDAIATALERLIENPELRKEMGENSRERALNYYRMERWERQTKEYFRHVVEAFKST
jgi:glycosyltransferase involved in cell wall biosynthesis